MATINEPSRPRPSFSDLIRVTLSRFINNITSSFNKTTTTDYVRMVAIVGGYMLLRPYVQKLGAKYQERDHARAMDENEESSSAATGKKLHIVGGSDDELSESDNEDVSWGKKQRSRQRQEIAQRKKEIEESTQDTLGDDDKDIEEFLVD